MAQASEDAPEAEPGLVPEGWMRVKLRDIVTPSKEKIEPQEAAGTTYLSLEHVEAHSTRIIGRGTAEQVTSTKAVFRAGDVLYGKLRPYLNKVCIPDFDGICSTDFMVFQKHPAIDPRYLMRFLNRQEVVEFTNNRMAGVQLPRVSFVDLGDLDLPLPPLAEQARIVRRIAELTARVDASRERLAKVPAIIRSFRKAVLYAACSGHLTEDWREAHPSPKTAVSMMARFLEPSQINFLGGVPKDRAPKSRPAMKGVGDISQQSHPWGLNLDQLPEVPSSWGYYRADSVVDRQTVISYGIVLPGPPVANGIPYIRGQDIENGRVLVENLLRTTPEIANSHRRSTLTEGDVLLCIIRHLKVAIVPPGIEGANLMQGTVRLRPSNVVSGPYLASYLRSPQAQAWMKTRYFGMSMPRINVEDAREIPIPIAPMDEQAEIVRRVEALFALANVIERRIAVATGHADKVTQSILDRAFRGELVPTEAELARQEGRDYEPAAALLERIRSGDATATQGELFPTPSRRGRRKKT